MDIFFYTLYIWFMVTTNEAKRIKDGLRIWEETLIRVRCLSAGLDRNVFLLGNWILMKIMRCRENLPEPSI